MKRYELYFVTSGRGKLSRISASNSLGAVHLSLITKHHQLPPPPQVLSSPRNIALNLAWLLGIPLWRELHFYLVHRFIHIRCIYKYVHALHHRDTNPEPFSGMSMHPVEHTLYFSNALVPCVFLNLSPLIFQWTMLHLVRRWDGNVTVLIEFGGGECSDD